VIAPLPAYGLSLLYTESNKFAVSGESESLSRTRLGSGASLLHKSFTDIEAAIAFLTHLIHLDDDSLRELP
jgi:hypothetical protein